MTKGLYVSGLSLCTSYIALVTPFSLTSVHMCTGLLTSHPLIIFYCISSSLIISPLLSSPILPPSSLLFTSHIPIIFPLFLLISWHLTCSLSFESLSSLIIRPRPLSSSPLRKPYLSSSYVLLNRCNFYGT